MKKKGRHDQKEGESALVMVVVDPRRCFWPRNTASVATSVICDDWTKEDVGVRSVVLGDAREVPGHFDSRNHVVTCCVKRVCGLASSDVARREVNLLCRDGGQMWGGTRRWVPKGGRVVVGTRRGGECRLDDIMGWIVFAGGEITGG